MASAERKPLRASEKLLYASFAVALVTGVGATCNASPNRNPEIPKIATTTQLGRNIFLAGGGISLALGLATAVAMGVELAADSKNKKATP